MRTQCRRRAGSCQTAWWRRRQEPSSGGQSLGAADVAIRPHEDDGLVVRVDAETPRSQGASMDVRRCDQQGKRVGAHCRSVFSRCPGTVARQPSSSWIRRRRTSEAVGSPMGDEGHARRLVEIPEPPHDLIRVGVRRQHRQVLHLRADRNVLAVDLDGFGARYHGGAARPSSLESGEEDRAARIGRTFVSRPDAFRRSRW